MPFKDMLPTRPRTITLFIVIVSIALITLILARITAPERLPKDAEAFVLKTEVYNPQNYFGGCQMVGRDCQGVQIRRAYELDTTLFAPIQISSDHAWCAQWEVSIRHPINGNYDLLNGWVIVIHKGSSYQLIETDHGALEGTIVCR